MSEHIIWVGLDVHKDSVVAAVLRGDSTDVEVIRLTSDLMRVRRLFRRLSRAGRFEHATRPPGPVTCCSVP